MNFYTVLRIRPSSFHAVSLLVEVVVVEENHMIYFNPVGQHKHLK